VSADKIAVGRYDMRINASILCSLASFHFKKTISTPIDSLHRYNGYRPVPVQIITSKRYRELIDSE
jgi:hypothetical protein